MEKCILTQLTACGVPIAVPVFWSHEMSPKARSRSIVCCFEGADRVCGVGCLVDFNGGGEDCEGIFIIFTLVQD
eukprot:14119962-Ditylum_brightwellii.AAC.1